MKKIFLTVVIACLAIPAIVVAQNTGRPVVKKETTNQSKGGTATQGKSEQSDPRPNATSQPDKKEEHTEQSDPRPNATSNPDKEEHTEKSDPRPNATSNPNIPDKGNNNNQGDDDDDGHPGKGKAKNGKNHGKGHAYGHYKNKQEMEAAKARDKAAKKK